MDKRFMKGRLALVALIAVLCIAIPAAAFAASSNTFPGSSTTTPGVVGVTFTGVSAASAQITIDGNARLTKMDKASSVSGSWVTEDVDAGAAVVIKWVWKPTAAADGQIKVYAFPTSADGLTAGPHAVIATVYDSKGAVAGTANWSYTIDQTIVNSGTEPPGTVVPAPECGAACHLGYNKKAGMGPLCSNCHSGAEAPVHGNPFAGIPAGAHDAETAYLATAAQTCVACHGTDVLSIALVSGEHKGCSCHAYGEASPSSGLKACQDCHEGVYAPHSFATGEAHGNGWATPAGGHNTTLYGVNGATSEFGAGGVSILDNQGNEIEQEWPLPNSCVFWSQSSMTGTDSPAVAMGAARGTDADGGSMVDNVRTDVGWGSVITCEDCHTGLVGKGPQGANSGKATLDPNFPDDWKAAELTTWDPTGMRSVATTTGTSNAFYTKVWSNGVTTTSTQGNGYAWGDLAGRFLCQKCHKLTDSLAGFPVQNRSGRSRQGMGVSNTAHMEHHPDQILGQGNCVSCHIGVPHGWKRPRLLVYESDPTPYLVSQPTTQTDIVIAGVTRKGNWAYPTNPLYAGGSTHLSGIYAGAYTTQPMVVPGYFKELKGGEATTNPVYAGWDLAKEGVEWGAPGIETLPSPENEGQPNCNGCSATGTTHTPASEGVPAGLPLWK